MTNYFNKQEFFTKECREKPGEKGGKRRHLIFAFPNGCEASVVAEDPNCEFSRYLYNIADDDDNEYWEIAIIVNGNIWENNPIMGDVLRYKTNEEVEEILGRISDISSAAVQKKAAHLYSPPGHKVKVRKVKRSEIR